MGNRKRKSGDEIGTWILDRELGSGGNADVWVARSGESEIALKILKRVNANSEPYKRFRQEIQAHQLLNEIPGILKLLDYYLPEDPNYSNPAWLAVPLAMPIREAILNTDLEGIVSAARDISISLVRCAEKGVFHRDIKPDNLYLLNGIPTVGDFGLACVPDKEALTMPGRKFGPLFFLPDELLNDAKSADPGPADVFMFAKTLWVLTTGQNLPPQGQVRIDYPQTNVSSYWNEPKANLLDSLIESCTHPIPDTRPTMKMVSDELIAWIDIGSDRSIIQKDLRIVAATLRPLIARQRTDDERQVKTKQDCDRIWNQIESLLEPLAAQISDATGLLTSVDKNNHVNSVVSHPKKYRVGSHGPSMNVVSKTVPGNPSCGFLISGIGLRSSDDQSTISLIAAHGIRGIAGREDILIWKSEREILPNTALESTAVHDLITQLHETLPEALTGLSNHLSKYAHSMENAE